MARTRRTSVPFLAVWILTGFILNTSGNSLKGVLAQESEKPSNSILFTNVSVFDGEQKIEPTNVLVVEELVAAIGDVDAPDYVTKIDGTGKTLMPGMIDCHTHVWFETHLKQAAMFGVTTELDMMSASQSGTMFRQQQKDGLADHRADFYSAGAAVTVKDGHGTQFGFPVPTLEKASDASQFVQDRVREGSDYIKLIFEDGSAYGGSRPTLTPEMFAASVKAAHALDKMAVSHVSTLSGGQMALDSEIDGLVHLFNDEKVTDEFIAAAKEKGVFIVPTASVVSNASGQNTTKVLIDDQNLKPLLNNENLSNLSRTFPQMPGAKGTWEKLKFNIEKLNSAGIPILAGTDAPNPGTIHGASMHHELRLLTQCGLSNEQALAAATSVPAKHFKLADRGRIASGLRADLILVEGDPTTDITAVSNIVGVWKGGIPIDRQTRMDSVLGEANNAESLPTGEIRLISDFEGEQVTAKFGSGWSESTDTIMGGDSTVKMKIMAGGADDSKSSLHISGKTREQQPAFSGVMFAPGDGPMQAANISANKSISFWAKGNDETFQIMLFFQKRGFQPSMKTFTATKEWKQYRFNIAAFDGCDGTDVIGFWFGQGTPGEFEFQIDQVELGK